MDRAARVEIRGASSPTNRVRSSRSRTSPSRRRGGPGDGDAAVPEPAVNGLFGIQVAAKAAASHELFRGGERAGIGDLDVAGVAERRPGRTGACPTRGHAAARVVDDVERALPWGT